MCLARVYGFIQYYKNLEVGLVSGVGLIRKGFIVLEKGCVILSQLGEIQ